MLKTLQIGLNWLPERSGGLPRYYHDLWRSSLGQFDFTGMVLGSEQVAKQSNGDIISFAPPHTNPLTQFAAARRTFCTLKARENPDLVVSHFALTTFPVRKQIDRPLVVHFQGPWAEEARIAGQSRLVSRAKFLVEREVYSCATRAIVLSQAFANILVRDYAFPRRSIDVIPAGVDTARFATTVSQAEARLRLGWRQDKFIALSVRRLTPRMGLEVLLEASAVLKKKARDIEIKIAGSGPLKPLLAQTIEAHELSNQVSLLGHLPDELLPLAYKAADITVVPSIALEGFGLVVLESLASGTPVIACKVGGLPEVLTPLAPQLLVEPNNPEELAQSLDQAMLGTNLPSAVECQAYADRFDWRNIISRVRQSYERALG